MLNTQLNELKVAKLVNVGIGGYDNRANPDNPFMIIEGSVCNVGRETAYNCELKIIANQGENQSIFFLTLGTGTIHGLGTETFSTNIYYTGNPIEMQNLIITPQWTTTP
ncbi:MAG: hypothetical protein NWF04_07840 [Candidatus Bathyarchaeota archaeon]|nr:hypothetical protein [Candidatus Bathyarchaeota archaeon]